MDKSVNMDIKSLSDIGIDDLFEAWEDAFRGYAKTWTREELQHDLHRRGYVPELSFGAFDEGRLASFTLNGIGMWKGAKTAYDTGTGTIKKYRGRGLATEIFNETVPILRKAGVSQYLLEALQDNTAAISVYTNIGFKIAREFNYFIQSTEKVTLSAKNLPATYHLRETDMSKADEMAAMWDFVPSWQNSFGAISRKPEDFKIIGVFDTDRLAGYGVIEQATGDIPQLAVGNAYKRQYIGSNILRELVRCTNSGIVKVVNAEMGCVGLTSFLEHHGIPKKGAQFEMVKEITMPMQTR
jgi:ribosomal protein S18 acetylase RimI-like enzyme